MAIYRILRPLFQESFAEIGYPNRSFDEVLIRAIEPLHGLEVMAERRGLADPRALCSGPGKLCQALGVTKAQDHAELSSAPFGLTLAASPADIVTGPRIGISRGADTPWRFGLARSTFLSRPFPTV